LRGGAILKGREMPWLLLLLAGLFEIGWAIGLKYTEGLTRLWPSVATIVAMLVSFLLLGRAVRDLPLGTAYAIWTGMGTIGTAVFGIIVLKEPATAIRLTCLVMIVAGIVGLKLVAGPSK
jgi:quaternary ammonium compound-resistance protein SugE